jgi:hypothetical protein
MHTCMRNNTITPQRREIKVNRQEANTKKFFTLDYKIIRKALAVFFFQSFLKTTQSFGPPHFSDREAKSGPGTRVIQATGARMP